MTSDKTEPYIDKTGTMEKLDPMRDVYHEFPRVMMEIARVTKTGGIKHAPRGWQTFKHEFALPYHMSKVGRHLLKMETEGVLNYEDLDPEGEPLLHPAQVAWNIMAWLEHWLRFREEEIGAATVVVQPGHTIETAPGAINFFKKNEPMPASMKEYGPPD